MGVFPFFYRLTKVTTAMYTCRYRRKRYTTINTHIHILANIFTPHINLYIMMYIIYVGSVYMLLCMFVEDLRMHEDVCICMPVRVLYGYVCLFAKVCVRVCVNLFFYVYVYLHKCVRARASG